MKLDESIKRKDEKISVIGLGMSSSSGNFLCQVADVIGFDISKEKVEKYHAGIDVTKEVGDEAIKETTAFFTWKRSISKNANSI
jgi:UDP-N-acetyl-D-galactosamine dehydrogenase